tara:strand:- start:1586 stop:2212 length:627 start_codon:yes stop_codon:yes gene_type:complete
MSFLEPKNNCRICERLNNFLKVQRKNFPEWHNKPVRGIGSIKSKLLIVGLAPGLKGANKTGITFNGDFSGDIMQRTLEKFNFIKKNESFNHSMNIRITNAVKCLPPQNKPKYSELKNCQKFLAAEIKSMKKLKIILSLGFLAHKGVIQTLNKTIRNFKFKHMAIHKIDENLILVNSYHCSRYNIHTKRLSLDEFEKVFKFIKERLVDF